MTDLKNIALTVEATQTASDLRDWIGISEQMDLIRLGFAYAVRHELDLERRALGTRGGSNYDTGGLDPDGLMASTVAIYYAGTDGVAEPYRAVETLMNKGLGLVKQHWQAGVVGCLADLLTEVDSDPADEAEG